MLHYSPTRINDVSHLYPLAPSLSPRDKYLAAIAEAKAAEAEYLAAEAVEREEAALRRRLQEIQLQKQSQAPQFPQLYNTGGIPFDVYDDGYLRNFDSSSLRRQMEEQERSRIQAEERARIRHRIQEEVRLRQLMEEEERMRAVAAIQKKAELEYKAHVQRQAEETRIALVRNHQVENQRRLQQLRAQCERQQPELRPQFPTSCLSRAQSRPQSEIARHPILRLFPGEGLHQHQKPTVDAPRIVDDVLKAIFGGEQTGTSQPVNKSAPPQPSHSGANGVQQFLDLLSGASPVAAQTSQPSTSSSAQPTAAPAAGVDDIQKILNLLFAHKSPQHHSKETNETVISAPSPPHQHTSSEASTGPKSQPGPIESSLKAALESRLNNEYATEIRDTIQAIFASLQNSDPSPTSASASASSSKGKGKAPETAPTTGSTSKNVAQSINEVSNIDATFQLIESEFSFPSQLDFIDAHITESTDPASPNFESSAIRHLSYNSQNNPVRVYEQSLSTLISQLDTIESFGDDALRSARKEVVGRVEKALENLEWEVEGRWRARLAKERKTSAVDVLEAAPAPSAVPATTTPAATPTEATSEQPLSESAALDSPRQPTQQTAVVQASPVEESPAKDPTPSLTNNLTALTETLITEDASSTEPIDSNDSATPIEPTNKIEVAITTEAPSSLDTSVSTIRPPNMPLRSVMAGTLVATGRKLKHRTSGSINSDRRPCAIVTV